MKEPLNTYIFSHDPIAQETEAQAPIPGIGDCVMGDLVEIDSEGRGVINVWGPAQMYAQEQNWRSVFWIKTTLAFILVFALGLCLGAWL